MQYAKDMGRLINQRCVSMLERNKYGITSMKRDDGKRMRETRSVENDDQLILVQPKKIISPGSENSDPKP